MSADNWKMCPRCLKLENEKRTKLIKIANNKYGKISAEEWMMLIEEAKKEVALQETLREDYGFSMHDDGIFEASYLARCDRCGFKHDFEAREQVQI